MSNQRAYPLIHREGVRLIMAECKLTPEHAVPLKFCLKLCHDFMKHNSIKWRDIRMYSIHEIISFNSTQTDANCISDQDFQKALRYVLAIIKSPPPLAPKKPSTVVLSARQLAAFQIYWSTTLDNNPSFIERLLTHSSSPTTNKYIDAVLEDQRAK
ncbi:hypothetical protein [Pseudomonas mandelii]|uniref:Uncharacterized protein n=1 Tax=Pseudomonas mandelii TaxID=75612 RepID=A0A502ICV9_9PSED|nr:hypothetical protein [Pseudomonas mandelii]TPG84741.1 hypothetical protein EAH74_11995 [Pseudomonas mandelii]